MDPSESDDPNAFVRINFADEGKENSLFVKRSGDASDYVLASDETATTTDEDMAKVSDQDTYGDGDDRVGHAGWGRHQRVAGAAQWQLLPVRGPQPRHRQAQDRDRGGGLAGNSKKSSVDLEITERKPFVLSIRAGVSLVSFPGDPLDPDINAVFTADHPAQEVITYDPTQPGLWFASKRDEATGLFDGNLMAISGNQAYLVRSNSTKDVSVVIDRPSSHDLLTPPQIDLVGGWNLVPVTDITYQLKAGAPISYADYFGDNEAINRVYGVDTVLNRLTLVQGPPDPNPDGKKGDDLEVGKGYWVFASEATSIAPGVATEE